MLNSSVRNVHIQVLLQVRQHNAQLREVISAKRHSQRKKNGCKYLS